MPDERLRLIFTRCHPAPAQEAQVALTLRLVCGVPAPDIARAFSEPAMAARITRGKKRISTAGIPHRVPRPAELPDRLRAVLAVNDGCSPPVTPRHRGRHWCVPSWRTGRSVWPAITELRPDPLRNAPLAHIVQSDRPEHRSASSRNPCITAAVGAAETRASTTLRNIGKRRCPEAGARSVVSFVLGGRPGPVQLLGRGFGGPAQEGELDLSVFTLL